MSRSGIVFVHGAWHGGWCWRDVAASLRSDNHLVFTPTLTGLGERAHLLSPDVALETHIDDIVNVICCEELEDVTLVCHSYGGMVATGVIDRLKPRIRLAIYLDAAVPDHGQSMITEGPPASPESHKAVEAELKAMADPRTNALPPFSAEDLGIDKKFNGLGDWVDRRLTPHPLKTWLDPIHLSDGGLDGVRRTYVHCKSPVLDRSSFGYHAQIASASDDWTYYELESGHEAMITNADEVTSIIRESLSPELSPKYQVLS